MQFSRAFFYRLLLHLRYYTRHSEDVRDELSRAFFCLQLIIYIFVITVPFIIIGAIFQPLVNVLIMCIVPLVFGVAYYIMYKGWFAASKIFLLTMLDAIVFVNGSTHGKMGGMQFLWGTLVCGAFLLFSFRQKHWLFLCIGVSLAAFATSEITDYSLFKNEHITQEAVNAMYYSCLFSGFGTIFFLFYYTLNLYYKASRKQYYFIQKLKLKNDSLKKLNNELDSFVYRASHDLRSPLSSLMALVNLAKSESDTNMLKEYIFHQEKSIKKLDAYIVDVLSLSRNARKEIESNPIQLKELIEDLFSQYAYVQNFEAMEKVITVEEEIVFHTDRKRLMVILNNLLSNALRYADPQKEKSYLHIKAVVDPMKATIVVSDNGIGIAGTHLTRIFQMFYSASAHSEGSGLGLYLVKEMVDKLGGKIEVSSEEKVGTSFTITLPNLNK